VSVKHKERKKERLDKLIVDRNIIHTRERARAYILGGNITVNGEKVLKPAVLVDNNSDIRVCLPNKGYVSRGGIKLEGALEDLKIDVRNSYCLDIGASTGGFTDCLLKRGAKKVVAVDVGKNQIDYGLRSDPRIIVTEGFNARYIDRLKLEQPPDIVTIDVSFISIRLILKPLGFVIDKKTKVITLIKPQFELEKPHKGFRGVIKERELHLDILNDLNAYFFIAGYSVEGYTFSKIKGPKGNIEYFAYLRKAQNGEITIPSTTCTVIEELVVSSHNYFSKNKRTKQRNKS
jgi:23S rRNA (cytidine1920-2'-O)/16S rRNA (cytidine1409-2'-O)-methyltransferase